MNVDIKKVSNGYVIYCGANQYIAKDIGEIRDVFNRDVIVPLMSLADNNANSSNGPVYRGRDSVVHEGFAGSEG